MRKVLALVATLAAAAPASAEAQDAVTPDGPATIRSVWTGASTMEGRPHEIITRWAVTVGPGGNPGFVRLRVFGGEAGTVSGNGQRVWLPAEPGTYEFTAPHVTYDYRFTDLGIDQETGGHAIVKTHASDPRYGPMGDPYELYALDVFRPPLADDASGVPASERIKGRQLMIRATFEHDVDKDALGDRTEDVGDLTALRARVRGYRDGRAIIVARVRNNGTTVRHLPHILFKAIADGGCAGRCPAAPLGPGEETDLAYAINVSGEGMKAPVPTEIEVGSEGPDTNPADNTVALTPNLSIATPPPTARPRSAATGEPAVTVTVSSDQPATVLVAARIAGVRVARTVRFTAAGSRAVRLAPARRADRARINRALRRRGRLTAIVTASAGRGAYAPDRRVVLRR